MPAMRLVVVNGPNLNLLGTRRPDVYGTTTLAHLEAACRRWGAEIGGKVETFQSNHEGALIDRLHAARGQVDGVVLNPGAYTHTSYALHDAIEAVEIPTVEVHISNVEEREEWRRRSVVRPACVFVIYGRGVEGYRWAIRHLHHRAAMPFETLAYGDSPDQVLDLRIPAGAGPHPLAVLVHGGMWHHTWARDTTEGLAVELTRGGIATANVETRRLGTGGEWPASVDDVVAAVGAVAGRPEVDPARVALVGQSSGGHLALLASGRLADRISLVVSLAGITDLADYAARDSVTSAAVERLLAGATLEAASPISRPPTGVPTLLIHGDADEAVPFETAHRYAETTGADLVVAPGGDHTGFLEPRSNQARRAIDEITARLTT